MGLNREKKLMFWSNFSKAEVLTLDLHVVIVEAVRQTDPHRRNSLTCLEE